MSQLFPIASASAVSAARTMSAGQWSHLLVSFTKYDDLSRLSLAVTHQRDTINELVMPSLPCDVLIDVADEFGLSGIAENYLAAIGASVPLADAGVQFAIPIGQRRLLKTDTLSIVATSAGGFTGTYSLALYDDGQKRAQGLPIQFVSGKSGTAGRPVKLFVYRDSTGGNDILNATDATVQAQVTTDGEGVQSIGGSMFAALSALADSAKVPKRAAAVYRAPDLQSVVSVQFSGSDAANWSFLCVQLPSVPAAAMAAEGAARSASISAIVAAQPAEMQVAAQLMGVQAKPAVYVRQADKFAVGARKRKA